MKHVIRSVLDYDPDLETTVTSMKQIYATQVLGAPAIFWFKMSLQLKTLDKRSYCYWQLSLLAAGWRCFVIGWYRLGETAASVVEAEPLESRMSNNIERKSADLVIAPSAVLQPRLHSFLV